MYNFAVDKEHQAEAAPFKGSRSMACGAVKLNHGVLDGDLVGTDEKFAACKVTDNEHEAAGHIPTIGVPIADTVHINLQTGESQPFRGHCIGDNTNAQARDLPPHWRAMDDTAPTPGESEANAFPGSCAMVSGLNRPGFAPNQLFKALASGRSALPELWFSGVGHRFRPEVDQGVAVANLCRTVMTKELET